MFYSKDTGGFYSREIHGDAIPSDAVEITASEHSALLEGQSQGKLIQADANGKPVLADPAPSSASEVWESIKRERDKRKAGGFKVVVAGQQKWFHSDADSRIQHLGLKDKARDLIEAGGSMGDPLTILGQNVKWKTMDGSFVDVTTQVAFDIVSAAGELDGQLFAVAEAHRVAMEASASPSSYDFSAGWPEAFA